MKHFKLFEIIILVLIPLLFSLADALMFRAKSKPLTVFTLNIWLELSKMAYIAMIVCSIYLGMSWQNKYIVPLLLFHFVCKSIPYNIVAGLKWNYVGVGGFDLLIRFVTQGSLWLWLLIQGVCVALSYYILIGKL